MGSSYRILIVDDVPLLRTIAKNYFNRNEFHLTTARTVVETIRLATAINQAEDGMCENLYLQITCVNKDISWL